MCSAPPSSPSTYPASHSQTIWLKPGNQARQFTSFVSATPTPQVLERVFGPATTTLEQLLAMPLFAKVALHARETVG